MIEEITIYRCPFCKAEYQSKETAEKCMVKHKVPQKIDDWNYGKFDEYPNNIIISFGEGNRTYLYKKERAVMTPELEKELCGPLPHIDS